MAAANPATSVTMPPPTAITTSARDRPEAAKRRASDSTVASVLASSPSAMVQTSKGRPGSRPTSQPASLIASWVTTTAILAPGGTKRATSWRAPAPTRMG